MRKDSLERTSVIAACLAAIVMIVCVLIHVGWAFDIEILKRPIPTTSPTNPTTAAAMFVAALSVIWTVFVKNSVGNERSSIVVTRVLGLLVCSVGIVALSVSIGHTQPWLHTLFWNSKIQAAYSNLNGPIAAPNTGVSLVALGVAIVLTRSSSNQIRRVANWLAVVSLLISFTSLIGYGFDVDQLYHIGNHMPMTVYTCINLVLTSLAILLINKDIGFVSEFFKPTSGGRVARMLVPMAILIPVVIGYLLNAFKVLFNPEQPGSHVVFIVAIAALQVAIVWYTSRVLNRIDTARLESEDSLRRLNEQIEQRIEERAKEIAKVERRLQLLIEHSYETLALLSEDGTIQYISPSVKQMAGHDAESRLHVSRLNIVYPEDQELARQTFEDAKKEIGVPKHLDHRIVSKSGAIMWVSGTMTSFRDDDGRIGVVTNFRDVTQQRATQEELRRKNDLLTMMGMTARIGGWVHYLDSGEFTWTDEMFSLHDLAIGEKPQGAEALKYFVEGGKDRVLEVLRNCRINGVSFDIEVPFTSALGIDKQVRVIGHAHKENGRIVYTHGTMQDVTELTSIENKLARTMTQIQEYQVALDESSIVAITDNKGKILHVNENFCKISKYTAQELLGKDHRIINSGYHPKDFFRDLWKTIGSGKVWHGEVRNRAKDGSLYWVDTTIVPFLDDEKKPYEYLAIRVDITERKLAEQKVRKYLEELERSNRDLEQFAYIASHDLQEPLRMVGSYMDLIRRRYGPSLDSDGREFIEYAVDGATRMKQLVNDLLQFSRINRQGIRENLDVQRIVERVLHNLQSRIEESNGEVIVSELPSVFAEETQIVQLFQNLIGNALKFRRVGVKPNVRVFAEEIDNELVFSVSDNGIGIEAKYADKVFVIFRQLHDKNRYDGTGIGLAVAKRIVERYGGRIWFESVYGQGTIFHFTIPGVQS